MIRDEHRIKIKPLNDKVHLPTLGSEDAVGFDIHSTISCKIMPNQTVVIPTGFSLASPKGVGTFIIPRSGLGTKHGIVIANGTGLIDPDYRGEVSVALFNRSERFFEIKEGDRIAQMFFVNVPKIHFDIVDKLDYTSRGIGGFGSTGGYQQ